MKLEIKQIHQQPITKINLFNQIAENKYFEGELPTVQERVLLVCDWQDLTVNEVNNWHINSLNKVVQEILTLVKTYQADKPAERIGNLTHRTDYLSFTIGHWTNIEIVDFENHPEQFMGLFYIEEGLNYGHEEKRGGVTEVVNPLSKRSEVILEEANLSHLINLLTFFLNTSHLLKKDWVLTLNKIIRAERKRRKAITWE